MHVDQRFCKLEIQERRGKGTRIAEGALNMSHLWSSPLPFILFLMLHNLWGVWDFPVPGITNSIQRERERERYYISLQNRRERGSMSEYLFWVFIQTKKWEWKQRAKKSLMLMFLEERRKWKRRSREWNGRKGRNRCVTHKTGLFILFPPFPDIHIWNIYICNICIDKSMPL